MVPLAVTKGNVGRARHFVRTVLSTPFCRAPFCGSAFSYKNLLASPSQFLSISSNSFLIYIFFPFWLVFENRHIIFFCFHLPSFLPLFFLELFFIDSFDNHEFFIVFLILGMYFSASSVIMTLVSFHILSGSFFKSHKPIFNFYFVSFWNCNGVISQHGSLYIHFL